MTHPQLHNQSFAEIKAQHGLTTLRVGGVKIGGAAFSTAIVSDGEAWADDYGCTSAAAVSNALTKLAKMRRAAA